MPASLQQTRSIVAPNISSIPTSYKDLTHNDVIDLTRILGIKPSNAHSSSGGGRNDEIKTLIAALPAHLKTSGGAITSFFTSPCCRVHSGLDYRPLISMSEAFRAQVEESFPREWAKVGACRSPFSSSKTSTNDKNSNGQSQFRYIRDQVESLREIWHARHKSSSSSAISINRKCPACILTELNGRVEACVVLGSCLLGKLSQRVARSSIRVAWLEEAMHGALPTQKDADKVIEKMWKGGMEMKRLRKEHYEGRRAGARVGSHRRERRASVEDNIAAPSRARDSRSTEISDEASAAGMSEVVVFDKHSSGDEEGGYDPHDDFDSEQERRSMEEIRASSATATPDRWRPSNADSLAGREVRAWAGGSGLRSEIRSRHSNQSPHHLDPAIVEDVQSRQSRRADRAARRAPPTAERESQLVAGSARDGQLESLREDDQGEVLDDEYVDDVEGEP